MGLILAHGTQEAKVCDFGWKAAPFELIGDAMLAVARAGRGPREQVPSIGCAIMARLGFRWLR
ncbi:MAG TPA: hypothetical protein VIV54_05945 [Burkholderiales bacterium]